MAMIGLEKWFMRSPLKKLMQRFFEFRFFTQFLETQQINLENKTLLEVGCGSGYGLRLMLKEFQPQELVGIDIDSFQVQQALRNCPRARVYVSDIVHLSEASNQYDGVFAFTVFHHIPEWKKALDEIYRVLKPHGLLLVNELDKGTLDLVERIFKVSHPAEARFTWEEFVTGLQNSGFQLLHHFHVLGAMGFFFCIKI